MGRFNYTLVVLVVFFVGIFSYGAIALNLGESVHPKVYSDVIENYSAGNITMDSDVVITGKLYVNGSDVASGVYVGQTGSVHNGDFGGYDGVNSVCDNSFLGSHICSAAELVKTQSLGISLPSSGDVWITAGAAKYSPAALPVNDCNGFTYGNADSYLGNFWRFDSNGGVGKVGHCANTFVVACCR